MNLGRQRLLVDPFGTQELFPEADLQYATVRLPLSVHGVSMSHCRGEPIQRASTRVLPCMDLAGMRTLCDRTVQRRTFRYSVHCRADQTTQAERVASMANLNGLPGPRNSLLAH